VLTLQNVARLLVVEGFDVPFDQWKIFTVVFRVTTGALLARAGRNVIRGVQSFVGTKPRGNFSVTIVALQSGLAPEYMATGAVGRSVERLMRSR